jgi:FtsP/CotA-like multicopper oxidase with cupredoxin domain
MNFTRRQLLQGSGLAVAALAGSTTPAAAAGTGLPAGAPHPLESFPDPLAPAARKAGQAPVTTLNGRSLPARWRDGAREFHLVAEEVEHDFAPGQVGSTRIKAWGYNGSTPGPTLEAVEGERVRIYLTNRLPEHTSIHWHGLLLPAGMDGVSGLTQPPIPPGETWVYEFDLRNHGTFLYHPHADELLQVATGLMGMFIVHPRGGEDRVDRDFAMLLHNWSVHPGTYRPDPSVMTDFNLWTFNSVVFPAIDPLLVKRGERVRIRIGNLSMHDHPMHLHGFRFYVTGGDGGRWPRHTWHPEVTALVAVGQTRDLEFVADVNGDWAFHCHKAHHTMNAMGHDIPNPLGVKQQDLAERIREVIPGYMAMREHGMAEHQVHTDMGHMEGPENTMPMMMGEGPFGKPEMGGMFTVVKVRDELPKDGSDPGWYQHPSGTQVRRVSQDPEFRLK